MSGHNCNIELLVHASDFEWLITIKLEGVAFTLEII